MRRLSDSHGKRDFKCGLSRRQRDLLEGRLEHGKGQLRALQDQMRREKLQTLQVQRQTSMLATTLAVMKPLAWQHSGLAA